MAGKNDFVLDWDKALGFRADPFVDKVFKPINRFLVNRKDEKEKLNWFFIKNYFFGSITAADGMGKTMMLRWLEDRLKKYNRIHAVYLNAAVFREQVNILKKTILPMLSFYEKSFSKPHEKLSGPELLGLLKKKLGKKSVTFLIDNASHFTDKNVGLLKSLKKEGIGLQLVVADTPKDYKKSSLSKLGKDELNIRLRNLKFDEAREMIKNRVGAFGSKGIHPFTDEELKKLYDKADKNPSKLLKLCRDEAIKILIHKKEMLEKAGPVKEKQAVKKPAVKEKEIVRNEPSKKEKGFRIRFAIGEGSENKSTDKKASEKKHGSKSAVHDEKHKDELLSQMQSTSPRRKKPEQKEDDAVSDTDKLLKQLAEEFEVD